jgi:signal transduction histidine kinase
MSLPLHVLILEDMVADAELLVYELGQAGFDPLWIRASTEQEYIAYLHNGLDLILADYTLPQFDALNALRILKARDLDIPFIVVTGTVSEEVIAEVMREGAADYLLKDRLARLGQSISHALEQKRLRADKRKAQEALRHYNAELEATIQARTAELERALAKERELNELKARFVSMISHEFRTPLAIIQGASDLLLRYEHQIPSESKHSRLEEIQQQVGRLVHLLDEILTISRAQSVGLELQLQTIDLESLIETLIQETATVTATHLMDISVRGEARQVLVDSHLMKRAIGNLLSNAAKYSPVQTHIGLSLIYEPEQVLIQVKDEGIGIPEEDQDHLFDLFHRGRNATHIPGTGLGLAIVKQVIEAHGGVVRLESETDRGSTFTLVLPFSVNAEPRSVVQ